MTQAHHRDQDVPSACQGSCSILLRYRFHGRRRCLLVWRQMFAVHQPAVKRPELHRVQVQKDPPVTWWVGLGAGSGLATLAAAKGLSLGSAASQRPLKSCCSREPRMAVKVSRRVTKLASPPTLSFTIAGGSPSSRRRPIKPTESGSRYDSPSS